MNAPTPPRPGLPGQVLELCRLRGGPQDLPWSPLLLAGLFVAATALDVMVGDLLDRDGNALARSLLSSLVILGLCWIALAVRNFRNRFVQTATAIIATGIVFTLLQGALLWLGGVPPATGSAPLTSTQALVAWALFAIFLWQVAVTAHIVRHAVELGSGLALTLVISWIVAWWALEQAVFGSA